MRLLGTIAVQVGMILALAAAGPAVRAERIALVIGNSAYVNAEALPNPRNDAKAVAAALTRLGFEVALRIDLDQVGLRRALREFGLATEHAEVALLFYAGHGIQVAGENYLLPTDAILERERDLLYEALPLRLVVGEVAQAAQVGIVIVDACRDNPLVDRMRRALGPLRADLVDQGLARMDQLPGETLVAFSTRPGEVAVDGEGELSPFTSALLDHIEEPGVELGFLFRKVRDDVLVRTALLQEPRTYDALGAQPFYFKPPRPNRPPVLPPLAWLQISENAGPAPLFGELPSDPDGDPLNAEVVRLPASGDVLVGERALQRGEVLTMQELGRAVYRPAEGVASAAGSFDYVVQDGRGGTAFGRVPITVMRSTPLPSEALVAESAAPALEAGAERSEADTIVSAAAATEAALELTAQDWRTVQRGLNRLGHAAGLVDGLPGPRTRRALAVWQDAEGGEPSGYLSADQLAALRAVAPTTVARAAPDDQRGGGATDSMAARPLRAFPQLAYVWAHEPDTARYVPSTLYNRSPDGRATVRRAAIGVYEIELGAILRRPAANVQVTGYGDDSEYCNLAGWGAGVASVRCFSADGEPRDANFSLLVVRAEPADASIAYALADQPARARYAAPAETVHNVAGPVQVSRAEVGQYALEFGEIAGIGANVQVTTVGADGERCTVVRWTRGWVEVACTQSDGRAGDAAFSVLVVRADSAGTEAAAEARFIYLWAPGGADAMYPAPQEYTHASDHQLWITRSSPGRYVVGIGPVIGERGGNAQVTAYGDGNQYCKIERWFAEDIEIRCFDRAGQPANSPFSLLFARAAGD